MEEVKAYRTTDGKIFPYKEQAQDHEDSLKWIGKINEFIKSTYCPYTTGAQSSMMVKTIVSWEKFKVGGTE
jgi:hypothetical protein